MRTSLVVLLLTAFSLVSSMSSAVGESERRVETFTIDLEDVPPERAGKDLFSLFLRENQNQLFIDLVLINRRVTAGRSRPTLYYLENLRVRPGDILRIEPGGRLEAFEARIKTIEAFFPTGKPPQFRILASGDPRKDIVTPRPYPRVSSDNFRGSRTLQESKGKKGGKKERKPDLIKCQGDTPGDLRIRFGSLIRAEDVGRAFSTTYVIDDVRHTYNAANGLQTRYFGTRHRVKKR